MNNVMSEPSHLDRSPTKIPRFVPRNQVNKMESDYHKPSRLQQMQSNFQQKLMREKEQKLIQIYEDNQKRTMNRLQSKGLVRDFFNERRTLEGRQDMTHMPSINQHYKNRKLQPQNYDEHWVERPSKRNYSNMYKNSAGRDRGNPLAPIDRNSGKENNSSAPPIPRKPQRHGRPWTKESQRNEYDLSDEHIPKSAPLPQPRLSPANSNDSTPPPNLAQLKSLQKQKLHMKKQNSINQKGRPPRPPNQQKMTDFQKWQMEQDNARAERLKKLGGDGNDDSPGEMTEDSGLDSDEKDEVQAEIERKQKELLAKIAHQEAELEKIRKDRQREEEEERKEMERRKRKEEERRRKLKEEEERMKILQAEAEERQRREEEEEFKRKLMQTDRIKAVYEDMNNYDKAQYTVYNSTDDEEMPSTYNHRVDNNSKSQFNQVDNSSRSQYNRVPNSSRSQNSRVDNGSRSKYNRADPTPPPQPKPARVVRKQQKRHSPVQDYNNSYAPAPSGKTDLSLYNQAANDPEAYGDSNIQMAPCSNCGRKFAIDRLQKHRSACGNLTKKRKVMDPTKTRLQGTEFEKYQNSRKKYPEPKSKPSNWRSKHEEFVQNIRYARKVAQIEKEGGNLAALPPPPKAENPDYVQCPWCSRKFNETAAERHIPRCKDLKTRPPPLKTR